MSARKVSIALATYNGAAYLPAQLESLLSQTRLPDELVVGDDNSRDDTVALIEQFAGRAPFPVRITVNKPGLGPADNFGTALARCTGDVIFLSDQDDIWHPDKIAKMLEFLDANSGCLIALHDAALVDGAARPLGMTMGQQIAAAGSPAAKGLVAGCCMAIDGRLARFYEPLPATRTHDAWLTSIADLLDARGYLDEPLIDYRRHGGNVSQSYMSGTARASRWRRFADRLAKARAEPAGTALGWAVAGRASAIAALEVHRGALADVVPEGRIDAALATLRGAQARDERRLAIHRAKRLARPGLILRALAKGDYAGGNGLLSLVRDVADAGKR
jgi:glycosyltransferase involved in cell wall biosynthesis